MDPKKIKILLEKYYNGKSTLDEELILREYFSTATIDEELIEEKDIFLYQVQENKYLNDIPDISDEIWSSLNKNTNEINKKNIKSGYFYLKIAASIIIVAGSYFLLKNQVFNSRQNINFTDTYNNPELAYQEAKKTLLFVSTMLNNGTAHLEPIEKIAKGTQELNRLSSFNMGLNELSPIYTYDLANKYLKQ